MSGAQVYEATTEEKALSISFRQYEEATAWCKSEKKGACAAMSTNRCNAITLNGFLKRLPRKNGETLQVINGEGSADRRILTTLEEIQLTKWIRAEARVDKPKNRDEIRQQVVEILKLRRETRGGGRRCDNT